MASKTATVTARIQPEIKETAEKILENLGIPVSVFIDMTYRQVIANNGVPFSLSMPKSIDTRDTLSDAQFNQVMQTGLEQAKENKSISIEDAFNVLRSEI